MGSAYVASVISTSRRTGSARSRGPRGPRARASPPRAARARADRGGSHLPRSAGLRAHPRATLPPQHLSPAYIRTLAAPCGHRIFCCQWTMLHVSKPRPRPIRPWRERCAPGSPSSVPSRNGRWRASPGWRGRPRCRCGACARGWSRSARRGWLRVRVRAGRRGWQPRGGRAPSRSRWPRCRASSPRARTRPPSGTSWCSRSSTSRTSPGPSRCAARSPAPSRASGNLSSGWGACSAASPSASAPPEARSVDGSGGSRLLRHLHARDATRLQLLRGLLHEDAEVLQLVLGVDLPHLGEQLVLLLLDMVLHLLPQHLDLRVELRVVGLHLEQVGDDPLHREVLLHRFLEQLLRARVLGGRVEVLLLDRRVDGERVGELVEHTFLLVGAGGLLDFLEQLPRFLVLLLEQIDRVHGGSSVWDRGADRRNLDRGRPRSNAMHRGACARTAAPRAGACAAGGRR